MEYSSPFGVIRVYKTLFSSTGIHHDDCGHVITMDMLTKDLFTVCIRFDT